MEPIYTAFGSIDLDPCGHPSSSVVATRKFILGNGDDGLRDVWFGQSVYVNPPFSAQLQQRDLLPFARSRCVCERLLRGIDYPSVFGGSATLCTFELRVGSPNQIDAWIAAVARNVLAWVSDRSRPFMQNITFRRCFQLRS